MLTYCRGQSNQKKKFSIIISTNFNGNKIVEYQTVDKKENKKFKHPSTEEIQQRIKTEEIDDRVKVERPENSILSIKQELNYIEKEVEATEEVDLNLPSDSFSKSEFQDFWTKYLNKLKESQNATYHVLTTAKWKLSDKNNIVFTFDSAAVSSEFEKIKENLLKELRTDLNNFKIQISSEISKTKIKKKYIKSRADIYKDIIKLNPMVEEIRIKLGLDIENE